MNQLQKSNLENWLDDIKKYCVDSGTFPVMVIGISEDTQELKLWAAANYPKDNIIVVLKEVTKAYKEGLVS